MRLVVRQLEAVAPERGSCGARRRLILPEECATLALSHVTIADARAHFHRESWEIYFVLAGEGVLHVDGEAVPLRSGTSVLVPPGSRHRAESTRDLQVLVMMSPAGAERADIAYVGDDA